MVKVLNVKAVPEELRPDSRLSCPDSNVSFQVECSTVVQSQFPDIYREFETLQAQVRRAAHDYIVSPQAGSVPLEVRNIEVRGSYGLLLPGGSKQTFCCGFKKHFHRSGFYLVF